MRKRKESTIRGNIFVFFLSLIIRNALLRGNDLIRSHEEVFLGEDAPELEKLHVIEDQKKNLTELEKTKKQKEILETWIKVSWC